MSFWFPGLVLHETKVLKVVHYKSQSLRMFSGLNLFRQKRMNSVMRSRGSKLKRTSWSSNLELWFLSQGLRPFLLPLGLHLLLKRKPLVAGWCPLLLIPACQCRCGNSCNLLWLTHPKIMFSILQLLELVDWWLP